MPARSNRSINAKTNVDLLLERFPATAPIFIRRRMHCVGCPVARFESLAEVCLIYRQPLAPFLTELRAIAAVRDPIPDGRTSA